MLSYLTKDVGRIKARRGSILIRETAVGGSFRVVAILADTLVRVEPIMQPPDEDGTERMVGARVSIEGTVLQNALGSTGDLAGIRYMAERKLDVAVTDKPVAAGSYAEDVTLTGAGAQPPLAEAVLRSVWVQFEGDLDYAGGQSEIAVRCQKELPLSALTGTAQRVFLK
jgi:hypothetical protein